MTFAASWRSSRRPDPDIIMVGEIKDSKIAQAAVRAAVIGQ